MRRTLSSAQTFLMKVVFPGLWIAGFATATLVLFRSDSSPEMDTFGTPMPMKWFLLGATVVGGISWYWWGIRLKRVEADEHSLFVSNYLQEVQVPLQDIERVTENRWVNIRPVTVTFRHQTGFGTRIVFMPRARWWGFWRPHPIVRELEDACRGMTGAEHGGAGVANRWKSR